MKLVLSCLIGIVLSLSAGSRVAHADPLPPGPAAPAKPAKLRHDTASVPIYAVSAGGVAVALAGSLVALRVIRKRNGE